MAHQITETYFEMVKYSYDHGDIFYVYQCDPDGNRLTIGTLSMVSIRRVLHRHSRHVRTLPSLA